MVSRKPETMQPLFRAITDDGKNWLFIVFSDNRWKITCDGEQIAVGTGSNASVDLGVQKFLSHTSGDTHPYIKSKILALQSQR
jgi:hypothetical protein